MAQHAYRRLRSLSVAVITFLTLITSACRRDEEDSVISCTEISSPTTWADRGEGIDYLLDCDLVVSAKLTIAPGVVIQCKNNASITIENNGALSAVGSAAAPIVFQGESSLAGVWQGLYIKSNSPENELRYCTILHAGSGSFDGSDVKAAIRLRQSSLVKILNSTISKSARDGIYIE